MRQLFRDSFARITLFSKTIKHLGNLSCAFCGSKGKALKGNKFSLKQYGNESDSVRPTFVYFCPKTFCCKSCHDAYNN